jgi:hypothetical protein
MTKDELLKDIEQRRVWDKAEQAGYDEATAAYEAKKARRIQEMGK